MSINKWMTSKSLYVHTIDYSIIKNEVLIDATTSVILENIMPSERNHHKSPHVVWFCLYEISWIYKSTVVDNKAPS